MTIHPEKNDLRERVAFLEDSLKRRTGELVSEMTEHVLLLKGMISESQDIIAITDSEGRICYINDSFTQLMGYGLESFGGKSQFLILQPRMVSGRCVKLKKQWIETKNGRVRSRFGPGKEEISGSGEHLLPLEMYVEQFNGWLFSITSPLKLTL